MDSNAASPYDREKIESEVEFIRSGMRAGKKNEVTVRSSAAEYLTFIAASGDDRRSIEMRYENENIWLTQRLMAELYDISVAAVNQHLKRLFDDGELAREATIKKYLIVQKEGTRDVAREEEHYSLQAIIAVGFKVNNERAVQFRKWANRVVKDYTIQGWTMEFNGHEILKDAGKISHEQAKLHAETEFEKYRIVQDRLFESDFDRFVKLEEYLSERAKA